MEGMVTRTGRAEETFSGLDCEAWSSLNAAVLLKQRLEAFFLGSLSSCMTLSREHLCEMDPRVHTFPVYVCGSIMVGRLAKSQAAMLANIVECGNGEQNDS